MYQPATCGPTDRAATRDKPSVRVRTPQDPHRQITHDKAIIAQKRKNGKVKKRIIALALAITAATTAVVPALAEDGVVYKQTNYWIIRAYPQGPRCIASTSYPNKGGDQILFGIDIKGWFLSLASLSVNMDVGKQYTVPVVTSLGSSGTYLGTAIGPHQIMIDNLTNADLYGWAKAQYITIVNMGTYNLKGSLDAIVSLRSCGDMLVTMRDAIAPQATAPQAQAPAPPAQPSSPEVPAPQPRNATPKRVQSDGVNVLEL
ncbi:hypothetical protein [Rhizobium mayense]|uniref:Uncharacterized protein n=1 Tax=Rhizobium mayense TaxID=1312184 RepID=A0ABT7JQ22_9HYPH|nr:hypothetical protein [Rhizobium mayense]MDL2398440.1 hypothetical protein [Rhizobium mayense]